MFHCLEGMDFEQRISTVLFSISLYLDSPGSAYIISDKPKNIRVNLRKVGADNLADINWSKGLSLGLFTFAQRQTSMNRNIHGWISLGYGAY